MRVLFIAPHPIEGPSSRYRVYQFLPYLQSCGVEARVRPFVNSKLLHLAFEQGRSFTKTIGLVGATMRRCVDALGAGKWDIIYVHRDAFPFGPPVFERAFKRLGKRLVFDFDDAIFLRSGIYSNFWDRFKDLAKPAKVIRMADRTVVGNEYLRQYAARHSDRVSVLPTVVDTDYYTPASRASGQGPLTVGWIGTPSSGRYVEDLLPVFRELAATGQFRFECIGLQPFPTDGLDIRFKPWSLDTEVADLHGFDIGIMPLYDDAEAKGKCGLKLLQYLAVGIPTVSSPVGVNADMIRPMENGLLASSRSEWTEALASLAEDAELRARLGAAGRETAEREYSLHVAGPLMLAILEAVHSGG